MKVKCFAILPAPDPLSEELEREASWGPGRAGAWGTRWRRSCRWSAATARVLQRWRRMGFGSSEGGLLGWVERVGVQRAGAITSWVIVQALSLESSAFRSAIERDLRILADQTPTRRGAQPARVTPSEVRALIGAFREATGAITLDSTYVRWADEALWSDSDVRGCPEPMVCEPVPWVAGMGGGYRTAIPNFGMLVVSADGRQRNLHAAQGLGEAERAANRIQSMPWVVDPATVSMMKRFGAIGLERDHGPIPELRGEKGTLEFLRSQIQRRRWVVEWRRKRSERALWSRQLARAEELRGRRIWLPVFLDFRGRVNSRPPVLSWTSPDMGRSALRLPSARPIESPSAVAACAAWGHSLWSGRVIEPEGGLAWARSCLPLIWSAAAEPHLDAAKPWSFSAFARAWRAVRDGSATDIPISLDATASGIQIAAHLCGDAALAASTNAGPHGPICDLYAEVGAGARERLRSLIAAYFETWERIHPPSRDRSFAKETMISRTFGMTAWGMVSLSRRHFRTLEEEHGLLFPIDVAPMIRRAVARAFWDESGDRLERHRALSAAVAQRVKDLAKHGQRLTWTTMGGFPTIVPVRKKTIPLRLPDRRMIPTGSRRTGLHVAAQGAMAQVIHSTEASILHRVVVSTDFPIGTAHDRFWCHAEDAEKVRTAFRSAFAEATQHARAWLASFVPVEVLGESLSSSEARLLA